MINLRNAVTTLNITTIILCLILFAFYEISGQEKNHVQISLTLIKQETVNDMVHVPFANRKITFRIHNKSRKPITLNGINSQDDFLPLGIMLRFDGNAWLTPRGNAAIPSLKVLNKDFPDKFVLKPGKSLQFSDRVQQYYVGDKFQRIIFIFDSAKNDYKIFKSSDFELK